MNNFDVIVIGAGSIGVPTAMALGAAGVKTLVIDRRPSPGQGENKHAIGGVRATHTDPAKITTCLRSLEIFSTWKQVHGDDIEWLQGGYAFPVYRQQEEKLLKSFLPIQKKHGLNIDFVDAGRMREIIAGINPQGLMGGTFSPEDGSVSPLLAINAFYKKALQSGVDFKFKEKVVDITREKGKVTGVKTDKDQYQSPVVIDAAGAGTVELGRSMGVAIPVYPESHEAGITEPVQMFCPTMVVDLRPARGSKNYYFYQNRHGQVVFCITPDPPIAGTDYNETSVFLPQVCRRMVALLPRLANLRVRRVWRGLYPMTTDGSPLVGWNKEIEGLLHAVGMCGQGFMLGPGLGEILARLVKGQSTANDKMVLEAFSLYRSIGDKVEALK